LVVDRAGLQKLFGVSPRTAVRMMNRFGAYQTGKTFLIGREELIAALGSLQATKPSSTSCAGHGEWQTTWNR
jgi:hypothetical protein